jgi:hypothetical protein
MLLSAGGFAVYRAETHVFNILSPRFGNLEHAANRARLLRTWLQSDMHALSGVDADQIRSAVMRECRNAGDFLRLVMEAVARAQDVPRWAETTPDHLLFLPEIVRTIPGALFLHVIRDGRDVAISLHHQGWIAALPGDRRNALLAAALYWEWTVRRGRRHGRQLGPQYLEVHYEDLVADPQATLNRIGSFIHHPLDYDRIRRVGIGSVSAPNTSFGGSPQCFVGRWKQQLSAEHAHRLEETLASALREFGYAAPTVSASGAGVRLRRFLYHRWFDAKHWLKTATPLGRYLTDLEMFHPGSVTGGAPAAAQQLPAVSADRDVFHRPA